MNSVTRLIFGMRAPLINTHLLLPRSRSSEKIKVTFLIKNVGFGGSSVSQTQLVLLSANVFNLKCFKIMSFGKELRALVSMEHLDSRCKQDGSCYG